MGLRDIKLRNINWGASAGFLIIALVTFGAGVLLGRYYPAQSDRENIPLEERIADICSGENVSSCSNSSNVYKEKSAY
jgi:hypothetical protein